MRLNIAHPLVAYISVWLLTVFLTSLQLTTNILPLNSSTMILVFSNIFSFILIYTVFSAQYAPQKKHLDIEAILPQLVLLSRYIKILLIVWGIGTLFEIIFSGGVPLQCAMMHLEKNYTHFGIPSFHGLMNALYLFSITSLFFDYLLAKKRKKLMFCFVLLLWPIIMIERGILLGAILQMVCVYFMISRVRLAVIFKGLLLLVLVFLLFGIIGDIRTSVSSSFMDLVVDNYRVVFENLPSGFLWGYVYITSPLNNIIANIDKLSPVFVPFYSVIFSIPTALRDLLYVTTQPNPISLVNSGLNVSTFYVGFLADFGILGAVIIVSVIQMVITIIYLEARRFKVWALLGYSALFQCIIFSIFFNLFLHWVYVSQVILSLLFNAWSKKMLNNK